MSAGLNSAGIAASLTAAKIGRRLTYLAECDSTNTYALAEIARDPGNADGLVVMTEHQSAGRGRLGRNWHAPRGASLLMTVVMVADPSTAPRLGLAAGIAIRDAIHDATAVDVELTWPNDASVRGRKLAGVLIESVRPAGAPVAHAIGIGINCLQTAAHFPPELRTRATSLEMESHHPIDRTAVASALLNHLNTRLPAALVESDESLAGAWRRFSSDVGRRIVLVHAGRRFSGTVLDIDAGHGLWLQLDNGGRCRFDPLTTSKA